MIRVYKYGLKPPADFSDDCLDELQRMNALWNKLVEIDRAREASFRALYCSYSPIYAAAAARIDALKEPIDALYEDIRAERVKLRSKEISAELQQRKDDLLCERSACWDICKAIQKSIPKELQKALAESYKADIKLARQSSGCYWGNYNAVIESFETAKSKAIKDGGRLHFKKFDGTGRFVNQIQGGMTADELFSGAKSQAKITSGSIRSTRGNNPHYLFTFTAFTGRDAEGRHFRRELVADLAWHRPIPAEDVIKSVEVVRELVGGKFKWHACFTVQLPDLDIVHPRRNIAGVNLGWRQVGSALRVAVLVDDKNKKHEYWLPATLKHKFDHAEIVQQQADDAMNDMLAWLREFYHARTDAPQDWKETAQPLLRTKTAQTAYAELQTIWSGCLEAFDSAAEFEKYKAWRKQDRRLRDHYTGTRRRAVAWREDLYRNFAKEIADHYAVIAITDTPLTRMTRTKDATGLGVDNELPQAARRNRVIAGISVLKEWIDKQAAKSGAIVEKISDKVTQTCHHCGHIAEKRVGSALYFTCRNCMKELEVDVNAAINCRKLASGEAAQKTKPPKVAKYARVREAMAAQNDSARNEPSP